MNGTIILYSINRSLTNSLFPIAEQLFIEEQTEYQPVYVKIRFSAQRVSRGAATSTIDIGEMNADHYLVHEDRPLYPPPPVCTSPEGLHLPLAQGAVK